MRIKFKFNNSALGSRHRYAGLKFKSAIYKSRGFLVRYLPASNLLSPTY